MSDALVQAIRARFAAAVAAARGAEAPEQVHALLARARGTQDGVPWVALYSSDNPNGPFLNATQAAELAAELDAIEADLEKLAEDAAETVGRFAERLIPDDGDRAEVLDDPQTARAATSGRASLDALLASASALPKPVTIDREDVRRRGSVRVEQQIVLAGAWWPGDVAPNDVLAWLASRGQTEAATAFRKSVEALGPGHPDLRLMLDDGGRLRALTFAGAAVLYSVERSLGKPDPRRRTRVEGVPLDVGGVSRRTYPALVGSVATGVEVDYTAAEARLVFSDARTGHKGRKRLTRSTLALPHTAHDVQLTFENQIALTLSEVLAAVARSDYGVQAARFLLGVAGLTALQRTAAGGSAVIYWEELAGLLGVEDDRDFRRRAGDALGGLADATIETRFPDGTFWADPLVAVTGFGSVGFSAVIARALYRGVREESGRVGRHWVIVPPKVLTHPRAALGAVILGSSFRASLNGPDGPVARFSASRFADLLGVRPRGDRSLLGDAQARETLAEVYAVLAASGYIADAPALPDGGDPTLVSRPGAFLAPVFDGGKIERGAVLPATGEELGRYVELARSRDGQTAKDLAAELGIGLRTLRDALDRGALPLPASVRRAFRRRDWGVEW